MNAPRLCKRCGIADLSRANWQRLYCIPCSPLVSIDSGGTAAKVAVALAVQDGRLPHISTQRCTDCGAQALAYDHRDYNKPLDVEPVCRTCNFKRGSAIHITRAPVAQET